MERRIQNSATFLLFLFCCLLLPGLPETTAQQLTVDKGIGVNIKREDPLWRLTPVSIVREYHEWVLDEGIPAYGSNSKYPHLKFKWNNSWHNQTAIKFDEFYEEIASLRGLDLCVDLMQAAPSVIDPNNQISVGELLAKVHMILEQKPVPYDWDGRALRNTYSPSSYIEHAAWMYFFTLRYGQNELSDWEEATRIVPNLHPAEVTYSNKYSGQGHLKYVESWNEQDKNWYRNQYPNTYFHPEEYAAMLSADFDGHLGTLKMPLPNGAQIPLGVVNADPEVKMVMGGIAGLRRCYVERMLNWFDTNRNATGHRKYPFHVINVHHYSNDYNQPVTCDINQMVNPTVGVSPEENNLRGQLEDFRNTLKQNYPDLPADIRFWLSEFGYDTNPYSPQRVPVITANGRVSDRQEVQGQWLVRGYLETFAAGFDRAMVYSFVDVHSDLITYDATPNDGIYNPVTSEVPWVYLYKSCGLLMDKKHDYQPKKSWYYVGALKEVMTDMVFDADLTFTGPDDPDDPTDLPNMASDNIRKYRFVDINNPEHVVLAVWSPTSGNRQVEDYPIQLGSGAWAADPKLIRMKMPDPDGEVIPLSIQPNEPLKLTVNERPAFIELNGNRTVDFQTAPIDLSVEKATCSSVSLKWTAPAGANAYTIYYTDPVNGAAVDIESLENLTLVSDKVESLAAGEEQTYSIGGLNASSDYTFIVIASSEQNTFSSPRHVLGSTSELSCLVPLNAFTIIDENPDYSYINPNKLFDEQHTVPICQPGSLPYSEWGQLWLNGTPYNSISCRLEFNEPYIIEGVMLYDGNGQPYNHHFEIQYEDPNHPGQWVTCLEYEAVEYNKWIPRFDLNIPAGVKKLRFIKDHAQANINEVAICGYPLDGTDDPTGCPLEVELVKEACSSATIGFFVDGACEVSTFKVTIDGQELWTSEPELSIQNLEGGKTYSYTVQYRDEDGKWWPQTPVSGSLTTLPIDDPTCTGCGCSYFEVTPDMIHYAPSSQIFNNGPLRLFDEQLTAGNTLCGDPGEVSTQWQEPWNTTQVYVDLGQPLLLSAISLYDGAGWGDFQVSIGEPGNWSNPVIDYKTSQYNQWVNFPGLGNLTTRYILFTKKNAGAKVNEVRICVNDPNGGDRPGTLPAQEEIMLVSPNPVRGNSQITVYASGSGYHTLQIFDEAGRLHHQQNLTDYLQYHNVRVDQLPAGIFFVRLIGDKKTISDKFLKLK